ncbi:hypothetical protein H4R20_004292, partial [Coemansia guatemalensis]
QAAQTQRESATAEYSSDDDDDDLIKRRNLEDVSVRDYKLGEIDSEDDEEIDSDEAFNDSDEERFRSYRLGSGGKATGSARSVRFEGDDSDDDEEHSESDLEEMDEDEGGAGLVDLSEMLDAGSSDDEDPADGKSNKGKGADAAESGLNVATDDSNDSDDDAFHGFDSDTSADSEDSAAEDSADSAIDASGDDAEKLKKLDGFVTSISARAPKHRFVSEAGGGTVENENTVGSGMHARGVTLGLDDLLGVLGDDSAQTEDGGEEKSAREMRVLREQVRAMEKTAKRSGSGVVSAPIPKRLQDQMDRKAAYAQTKKSISEWQAAVDANRAAEHLTFPMNDPGVRQVTTRAMVGDKTTKTAMEEQIQDILAQSGMTDEQQRQYEELELKQLSLEEVRTRQRDLRMMRELMFRSERKAKRTAKIKSKAYRRILKKDKDRAKEQALDRMKEDDPEMYEMVVEKLAKDRAEERITLRHKNTGKWAKAMAKRSHDVDTQQALRDQLSQHDALKRKIYDIGSDEEVSDYEAGKTTRAEDGQSDSDNDASFASIKGRALDKLSAEAATADDEIPADAPHKALFGMKFMQNAMQRKHEQASRDAQMMRDEFEALEADVDDDGRVVSVNRSSAQAAAAANNTKVENAGAPGRMSFGGGLKKRVQGDLSAVDDDATLQNHTESGSANDQATKRVRLNDAGQVAQVASGGGHRVHLSGPLSVDAVAKSSSREASGMDTDIDTARNPWLDESATAASNQRSANSKQLSKESTKLDKLSAKLREKRHDAASGKAESSQNVLLDMNQPLLLAKSKTRDSNSDDEQTSDEEAIKLEHIDAKSNAEKKLKAKTFSQRELVEQAFAEDDVVEAEFAAEKEAEMELDAPKTEDLTIPGWGSWGGAGLQPKKNKVIRKPVPGSGIEKSSRRDAKMGSVIINHRQLKTANKYYASNVPFPFTTSEQYEATMRMPLGKEWNTTKSHSKMIKPRVMAKAGRIIDPLSIPSKKRQ